MSAFIQALRRAELARQRYRQDQPQRAVTAQTEQPEAPQPANVDAELPLLDLTSAVRLGQRE